MKNATTHNDNDTWQTLAAATARALEPKENKNEGSRDGRSTQETSEQRQEAHRQYVEQRLREMAAFEDRARGIREHR